MSVKRSGWVCSGAAGAALLAWLGRASGAIDFQPVTPELLRGSSLYAPDLNLSLDAPGSEWEWLVSSEESGNGPNRFRAFACRLRGTPNQFVVAAFHPYWDKLTSEAAERFSAGVAASFKKQGWELADQSLELSEVPLPGSYRFQLSAIQGDGRQVFVYGYQAVKGRMFTFQHVTRDASEPPAFRAFVRSFHFVGTTPEDPLERFGQSLLFVTFALTLLVGGAGSVINKMAGRLVVNPWNVAIVLLLLGGLGFSLYWLPKLPKDLPPERWGYVFGSAIVSPVLWPLVVAIWRSCAWYRRRASERSARASQFVAVQSIDDASKD